LPDFFQPTIGGKDEDPIGISDVDGRIAVLSLRQPAFPGGRTTRYGETGGSAADKPCTRQRGTSYCCSDQRASRNYPCD
jgi:hypothetical protein